MKTKNRLTTSLLLGCLLAAAAAQGGIVHRYSFNEPAGTTTVKDSVGTADGVLAGNGADYDGSGQLLLPGGTSSSDPAATIAGYVDLPNHIINVLTNISLETWVTWQGAGSWQRVFDLGTSAGGENISDGNGNYLFLSPQGPDDIRFAIRDPADGAEHVQATSGAPLETAVEVCLTVSYDYDANVSILYSNGFQIASSVASTKLSTINDVNNWLGRSQWGDQMFFGSYNEFRIYNNALNPVEVASSYAAGPANPTTDPAALGPVQAVHLNTAKTNLFEGDTQATQATADFANFAGIRLIGVPGVVYSSDNPSSATISSNGVISAVSAGSANVGVSYLGKNDTVTITVQTRLTGVATAGTLYAQLQARGVTSDGLTWTNQAAGQDNFNAEGTPAFVANVEGTGVPGVKFSGTEAFLGAATTSDLDGSSDRSIEVWVFNPAVAPDETLVAWGHRGGPNRSNMAFGAGGSPDYGAAGQWGEDVGWAGYPVPGVWHYLVYTYGGPADSVVRVYADGLLKNTRSYAAPLDTYANFSIRIGAQGDGTGAATDFGQALNGYIGLVRVQGGALTALDVKNNFLFGMELTDPGALQGITLKLSPTPIVGIPSIAHASVFANYANRNYLFVTGQSTFDSSNTNVATVDAAGVVTAHTLGSADITATFQGKKSTQTVQIVAGVPAKLVHRYSFSEAPGSTTVADSVGTANGILKGVGGDFDGAGQLVLPGGVGSATEPPAGYVDLPNGIISALTNASFEAWVTWDAPAVGPWQRIFDFGTSSGGEDLVTGSGNYLFLSPAGDANIRFAVRDPATAGEPVQLTAAKPLALGSEVYLAVTYNYAANESHLYSNAVNLVTGPAVVELKTIQDVNNWLGRSQWNDQMFQGKFNEFRIWEGALSPDQVAASRAAGPDSLPVAQPALGVSQQGSTLVLTWPGTATGYAPESTGSLNAQPTWSPVPGTPTLVNGQFTLTIPVGTTNQFIRLKK
jgi:hypothetical protein